METLFKRVRLRIDEKQCQRIDVPMSMLMCYALFSVWQMGVVFFSSTALSLDGKTPLPIHEDNMTDVIVMAYIISIVFLIFYQRFSVITAKIGCGISLVSAILLYVPFDNNILAVLLAVQTFCCVFMIGVCISIAVNYFTETTELYDILISSAFGGGLIAILQNDVYKLSYEVFHVFTIVALVALMYFFNKLPVGEWKYFDKKQERCVKPRRFIAGVYLLIGLSCIITLFGSTVAESARHGVSVLYISSAVCALFLFLLWKRFGISPLRCAAAMIGMSAIGFVLAIAGADIPVFVYAACVMLGFGVVACMMTSLYGIIISKIYPSQFITPVIIMLAVVTVILQSMILDVFRQNIHVLYIVYAIITIAAAVIYLVLEPYLIWSVHSKSETIGIDNNDNIDDISNGNVSKSNDSSKDKEISMQQLDLVLTTGTNERLSGQELRVAELILSGYTGTEMSAILGISENTVKGYRKNLYSKLQIHSRRELFELAKR